MIKRKKILITGRVQGVGFRPAVYRLAGKLGLSGCVGNDSKGVSIQLQGRLDRIENFLNRLTKSPDKPPLAQIESYSTADMPVVEGEKDFSIVPSESNGEILSQVTEDIATCSDCVRELFDREDFRFRYPFINCTNCGPRYSIVKNIPYDRSGTTMADFQMCSSCAVQYKNIEDRRFHAQPVACSSCGPKVWLCDRAGKRIETDIDKVIAKTARLLLDGRIVAVKGIGGFHLAVNALDNAAVERLRQRKKRDHKPFAMMAGSVDKIREYALVNSQAEHYLVSPQCPIVLLPKRDDSRIAESVACGVNTYAFMLCYAPLHHLLFAEGLEVLVMTSGNISDEPLICRNSDALERLAPVADMFLMHNRRIYRQVDDSVIHIVADKPVLLRRARSFVPAPILTGKNYSGIFAAGADMKNTFCLVKAGRLICSEHIGDLENAAVYRHYVNSVEHFKRLYEFQPETVVCDLHPCYLSSQYALSLSEADVIKVQHHWAHIASVLAEHRLEGPLIGLVCDGTGYGTDGKIWGCECLIAGLEKFERFGHLDYYQLAGADKASKEAVRSILGLLKKTYGDNFKLQKFRWLLEGIEPDIDKQNKIIQQIDGQINSIESSSLGRVFDAVSAMLGLGGYNHFEAQLPMVLESVAAGGVDSHYDMQIISGKGGQQLLDFRKMMRQIIDDIQHNVPAGVISGKFHNSIAAGLLDMAMRAKEATDLNTVALSGGVFCNRYLSNRLIKLLKERGFCVLFNRVVPSNDGGISLGQAAIASSLAIRR